MRWLVEVLDIFADDCLFTDLLSRLNLTLHQEDGKTYLTGDEFEQLSTSAAVWERAEHLRDVLSTEVSKGFPDTSISFRLGYLYESRGDGSRHTHVFISVASVVGTVEVGGTLTVTYALEITEEERAKLEAERKEREYQEKLDLISSRVLAAVRDKRAREVQGLLEQGLNQTRMYHIYELIKEDLGEKKLGTLASKTEWSRFRYFANYSRVPGDDPRHIIPQRKTPSESPMSHDEALKFISKVADLWFKQKYVNYRTGLP